MIEFTGGSSYLFLQFYESLYVDYDRNFLHYFSTLFDISDDFLWSH